MSSFTIPEDPPSHLLLTASLALVAAIPNHAARYSALLVVAILAAFYTIHIQSPLSKCRLLANVIDETDILLRRTMSKCPRDYLPLTEQMGHLLEASKTASQIKCRIFASDGGYFSWRNYRVLCNDIFACAKRVRTIRTAIQLTRESEHQRNIDYDIAEVEFILAAGAASSSPSQYHRAYRRAVKRCLIPNLTLDSY
ncbi:hypothetical protein C8R45DRAFT_1112570 [Mycena sanguinolenta]|nr:hypothetical protein C8R45DRAFT_1112570 [Mycena sanguinolenta]